MILLPANLGHLAKCAAQENERFSLKGVQLTARENGYRAVATNGRMLAIVDGDNHIAESDFPPLRELAQAPNGEAQAIVPAKAFAEAMKSAPKRGKHQCVGCVIGKTETTFAATNLDSVKASAPRNNEGRYPDFDCVVASVIAKEVPVVTLKLNADMLATIASVAKQFCADGDDCNKITLEVRDSKTAVVIRVENNKQKFLGLIMPIG